MVMGRGEGEGVRLSITFRVGVVPIYNRDMSMMAKVRATLTVHPDPNSSP